MFEQLQNLASELQVKKTEVPLSLDLQRKIAEFNLIQLKGVQKSKYSIEYLTSIGNDVVISEFKKENLTDEDKRALALTYAMNKCDNMLHQKCRLILTSLASKSSTEHNVWLNQLD